MFLSMIGWLRSKQRCHVPSLASSCGIFLILLSLLFVARAGAQGLQPGGPFNFGPIAIGSSSPSLTEPFSAPPTGTIISSVIITEDGAQNKDFVLVSTTCVGTLLPNQGCDITIKFSPLQVGLRKGALSVMDGAGTVTNRYYLYGIGLGPQIVFSPVTAVATSSFAALSPSSFQTSTSVYDGAGNLYFNDYLNSRILKLSSANTASLVTSQVGNEHSSMAINGAGVLYVSSPTQGTVQVIVPGVSNTALNTGSVTLVSPSGVAVDGTGFIYVADSQTNQIARIAPDGSSAIDLPLTGLSPGLSSPFGLAVDANNLYIADSGNGRIVEVSLATGAATAVSASNAFTNNFGVAVDAAGNLIVANTGGSNIEELTPAGAIFAFAPDTGNTLASTPLGLNLSTSGDIISSDAVLGLVAITRSTGELTFSTPTKVGFLDTTDGFENLTVQNSGNEAIQYLATDPAFSTPAFGSGPANTCPVLQTASTPLAVGATCTYSVGFTPSVVGPNDGTLTVSGTAVGTAAPITAFSNLIGTGITPVDTLKVTASPTTTAPGVPVSFTVTALEGTTVITAFTGTVTFTMTDATGVFLSGTSYTFTTADAGVHTFAAPVGAQFNTPGTFTISAHLGSIVGTSNPVVVAFPSQTTLTSSVNPSFINQQTTLAATVSSTASAIVPTGTITFMNGTASLGTCTLVAGHCSLPVSFPIAGSYSLTAVYGSDTNFASSTSTPPLTQTVIDFAAQASLTSSINPSFVTQQTTLTATVVVAPGQPGAGAPTGTVTFKDGTTTLGTVSLIGSTATLPVAFTTAGNHILTATYNGNTTTNFGPVTSPTYTQVVNDYAAVAAVTSSINPSFVGQQTTLTATVTAVAGQTGAVTPTGGTVTFKDGAATLGTAILVNGAATFPTSFAVAGSHNLTVVYSNDATFATVTSAPPYVQVVNQYTAQAVLTSSINPSFVGQQTTLTATITAVAEQTGSATPTGTVTFKDGTTTIGTATLTNGVATLPTSFTPSGTHPLTVTYSSASYATVTSSPAYPQVVNQYASQVALTSSVNPSLVNAQTILTASVSAVAGQTGSGKPTGTVTFKDGAAILGTAPLTNGVATFPVSFAVAGNHNLTAVYDADTSFLGSISNTVVQAVVNAYTAGVTLTSSASPVFITNSVTLTATVAATAAQGTPAPTGTVTFLSGTTPLGSATLVNGIAALPTAFPSVGNYAVTAVYSGDTNFLTASSPVLTEVVEDFTIAVASGTTPTETVLGGSSTTYTFTLTPVGGSTFAGPISFGLIGFPPGTTATFSPATLASGAVGANVTLTVQPPVPVLARLEPGSNQLRPRTAAHYAPVVLALLVLPFAAFRRRRRPVALFLWLLLCASAIGLTGCLSQSSSGYYGNTPTTYNITVSGNSGTLSHSTNVSLTVQ